MTTSPRTEPSARNPLPIAVWPSAQITAQQQRKNRYLAESKEHPAKMLPSLARRIVEEYSVPGDLVLDPMAGSGTTVVEAAAIGRRCIGIELDPRWAALAQRNVAHSLNSRQRSLVDIRCGDARNLQGALGEAFGSVDLIATSPPYACDIATIDKQAWLQGGSLKAVESHNYSPDKSNLGHARGDDYASAMLAVYQSCFDALRPGGLLVTVTKNMRRNNQLVDLAGLTVELGRQAGFTYLQHVVSLLCGVRDSGLVGRPSLWQIKQLRAARDRGFPLHLVAHEDVIVLSKRCADA